MRTTDTHFYFWRGWTSNWKSAQIIDPLTGLTFANSEQAYMWYKADFFKDANISQKLNAETNPKIAKGLARQVKGYDDKVWSCVRVGFMTYVNLLKYQQNPDLKELLLNTGNRILVEASPMDKIWGVGLAEEDDLILDEKNWRGQNLLGKALMEVRKLLK